MHEHGYSPNIQRVALRKLRMQSRSNTLHDLTIPAANRLLWRQSSETLAGRIRFLELTPFRLPEVISEGAAAAKQRKLWLRGGGGYRSMKRPLRAWDAG